jgi:hypothetical protein
VQVAGDKMAGVKGFSEEMETKLIDFDETI